MNRTNLIITILALVFVCIGPLAMGSPKAADVVKLIGKGQRDVVKVLGSPASTHTEKYFSNAMWHFADNISVTFLWSLDGAKFLTARVSAGMDWKTALNKVGLNPKGIQPVLTSELGIELYKKKQTFELKGLKGLPSGAYGIWNLADHTLEFYSHRP